MEREEDRWGETEAEVHKERYKEKEWGSQSERDSLQSVWRSRREGWRNWKASWRRWGSALIGDEGLTPWRRGQSVRPFTWKRTLLWVQFVLWCHPAASHGRAFSQCAVIHNTHSKWHTNTKTHTHTHCMNLQSKKYTAAHTCALFNSNHNLINTSVSLTTWTTSSFALNQQTAAADDDDDDTRRLGSCSYLLSKWRQMVKLGSRWLILSPSRFGQCWWILSPLAMWLSISSH